MAFNEECYALRDELKALAKKVQELRGATMKAKFDPAVSDMGEMIANVTLAYRHIEDATMRLGKAVQAFDGGTSVYPR